MTATNDALMIRAARLHYDHGLAHHEVAALLGLSRIKVTRLLAEARRAGLVEIIVHGDARPLADLEQRLQKRFGLSSAWIAPGHESGENEIDSLGAVGAECLAALVPGAEIIAVGTSSTVARAVSLIPEVHVSEAEFVPISGSISGLANTGNPHTLAFQLARRMGGVSYHLPAPLVASEEASAATLRADASVAEVLDRASRANVLVAGLGGIGRIAGQLGRSLSEKDYDVLRNSGVVGDISARFFDRSGRSLHTAIDRRVIGLTLEQIYAIPERIGIAAGPEKLDAIQVAAETGVISVLVTDSATAQALLAL